MPALILPWIMAQLGGFSVSKAVGFLFSPAGAILCIGLAFGGGDLYGRHRAATVWRAKIHAMEMAAQRQDQQAGRDAAAAHAGNLVDEHTREVAAEKRISDYAKRLADKGSDCQLDDDDLRILAPDGVRN